jgi:hypothetical protein
MALSRIKEGGNTYRAEIDAHERASLDEIMALQTERLAWSLKLAYDKAMAALQPRYGNWVIFEHCMPFDVSRAYDEAKGLDHPRIWTAERDIEMWSALEKAG